MQEEAGCLDLLLLLVLALALAEVGVGVGVVPNHLYPLPLLLALLGGLRGGEGGGGAEPLSKKRRAESLQRRTFSAQVGGGFAASVSKVGMD